MEILNHLIDGFGIAFEPLNLALIIAGVVFGLFIGAMPGLGSVNGVAILLPMTFLVPPTGAVIFLAAIYYGAMYGGAISSIMLGIPGASTAVATTFDGRPLALQGLADKALVAAATPGSLMAYGVAKTMAKDPETFGKGNIDGVVAPEAANNAASTGSMLPMLTLGIPGSPTTAILLGGMVIWGLEPGPLVFTEHPDFVWGLIASLYAANLFALLINIAFIPAFIAVLKMPFTILAPIIFILCVVGGYVPTMDMHDVWLMLIFGIVGYLLRKLDYPMAPAVLAIVLGPLAEPAMRQSLIGSHGDFMIFLARPISGTIMAIALILFALPLIKILRNWVRTRVSERPL